MKSDKEKDARAKGTPPAPMDQKKARTTKSPEWANGLRQLYDQVVEEPLPESFHALLSKLDADD